MQLDWYKRQLLNLARFRPTIPRHAIAVVAFTTAFSAVPVIEGGNRYIRTGSAEAAVPSVLNSYVAPTIPFITAVQTSGATSVTIATGFSSGGNICVGLFASSTTSSLVLTQPINIFYTPSGGPTVQETQVLIPGGSGTSAGVGGPVNLLSSTNWPGLPVDQNSNPFLQLSPSDTFTATSTASAASNIAITAICPKFQ